MIDNPEYKGEWTVKRISNPAYKGVWEAKKIANPEFVDSWYAAMLVASPVPPRIRGWKVICFCRGNHFQGDAIFSRVMAVWVCAI